MGNTYLKIGRTVAIYILALSVIDVVVVLVWGLNTSQTVMLNVYCWLLFTVGQIGYQIWKRRTRKPREELSFGRPKILPDEVFQLAEREPVSLFDPAPDAGPIRTWSERRKEWVMIHPQDCTCEQCYFPVKEFPPDGDLYRARAKQIFKTEDPTPDQRDFAKRLTWLQSYGGTWVESEKPTTRTTKDDASLWNEDDDL